jgi:hypothetical protein
MNAAPPPHQSMHAQRSPWFESCTMCQEATTLLYVPSCTCHPAEPPDAGLPDGWAVALDPNGKPYYWHKATQKTQWEKPTA